MTKGDDDEKLAHHMHHPDRGNAGIFTLTQEEAEQLREKGWLVVPVSYVDEAVQGHLNVFDHKGRYVNSRMLNAIQVGDLKRQGYHLTHVADASKDLEEMRTIQKLISEKE